MRSIKPDELESLDPDFHPAFFARREVSVERRSDGAVILRGPSLIEAPEENICNYIRRWAAERPSRVFLAARGSNDAWVTLTYADAWRRVSAVGQALLDRGLAGDRPIAILSPNSIEHALVAFGAMSVGIPVAPLSPQYSRMAGGLERLQQMAQVLQPALVFTQHLAGYERTRQIPEFADVEWVSALDEPHTTPLDQLEAIRPGESFFAAFHSVRPNTVAKIIFTSGSTGIPKGVLNTHGNLCTATAAVGQMFPWFDDEYVLVDWLPWNHSLGGTSNIDGVLHNGGTMYIDRGRPLPGEFDETIRNLTDISPSFMQNVPAAYQMLTEAMERNAALRVSFFRRLRYLSYSGASLPQETWDRIQALAVRTIGKRIAFVSAWGATEAGPGISSTHWFDDGKGQIGLPLPSFDIKLVPFDDRYEARVRGPAITPGYLGNADATAKAFDEEGFYRVGDALRFVDPGNPQIGLQFAGRASENFKLVSGTFVNVGALRLAVLAAAAPLLRDVVIAGEGRSDVRILAWPNDSGCVDVLAKPGMPSHEDHGVIDAVRNALGRYNEQFPNASRRIAAFHLLAEPASLGRGETTDKGYINQRGVLSIRASLVEELYSSPSLARVIVV